MAKIVQSLTRAAKEYQQTNMQSLVRDLDGIITMIRRYFAEKELKRKKGLANGGRAMFKNGGLASIL